MNKIKIDLEKIRGVLPEHAIVTLKKTEQSTPYFEIFLNPYVSIKKYKEYINAHRKIIGRDNISEFYTEEIGRHWFIYLKRNIYEFENATDDDVNSFTKLQILKNGELNSNISL